MNLQELNVDFCVVGGGIAGVCAALAAARNGSSVVLLQDRSVLGGNASSEIRMHIVGADCHGLRPGARETGILEELRLEDAVRNPQRSYSMWDLLLYEKVKENPRITLLLETASTGCLVENGAIKEVYAVRSATEERFTIRAPLFADCSGDGGLGAAAGAECRMGRESSAEYNESLAIEKSDGLTLGSTILFTTRKHATPQPFRAPSWARPFQASDFKHRCIYGFDYGFWWIEWGGHLDAIRDIDAIRHELFRVAYGIWDYIKNSGDYPNSSHYALDWVGSIPGKRESRRFIGHHVLTQDDVISGRTFADQVAYGGWWIDLHPPQGIDAPEEEPASQHRVPHLYGIPLRSLHSKNISNLFFAGRNISATHVAFASTRVMGTCAVMGQGIGTAASVFLERARDQACSEISIDIAAASSPEALNAVQQALLRNDAYLPGVEHEDPADIAKEATCLASSTLGCALPSEVIAGPSRPTNTEWGPWATSALHRWESMGLPATLSLSWTQPRVIKCVEIIFCSGLERELLLTLSEPLNARVVRGYQPEVVCDYNILIDGKCVQKVRGNYLRKVRHLLEYGVGSVLQIEILSTHGCETARVYEVRVYES